MNQATKEADHILHAAVDSPLSTTSSPLFLAVPPPVAAVATAALDGFSLGEALLLPKVVVQTNDVNEAIEEEALLNSPKAEAKVPAKDSEEALLRSPTLEALLRSPALKAAMEETLLRSPRLAASA